MDPDKIRKLLLAKRRELRASLVTLESEGAASGVTEVRDSIDVATASQGTSEAFEEGSVVSQDLEQVQDALRRLEDGSYGKCAICGRPIEPARLEAIPWAPYCLDDQQKLAG